MNVFPFAANATAALAPDAPTASTAERAASLAGGPVYLAVEMLPQAFTTIAEAEGAFPSLYGEPRFEISWASHAWRVSVRYWRPAPAAPVARNIAAALRRPIAFARTPQEARSALGAPAELALEPLAKRYRTHAAARGAQKKAFDAGFAQVVERDGGFAVAISFWRPIPTAMPGVAPAERATLALRAAAPLTGPMPQLTPYVGLFERLAPENAAIVLAEEGDGRFARE